MLIMCMNGYADPKDTDRTAWERMGWPKAVVRTIDGGEREREKAVYLYI